MRDGYYDRDGNRITQREWASHLDDMKYKRVAETTLPDGRWISTVWLGLDHNFMDGPPLIFETMVFPNKTKLLEIDMKRYASLEDARLGHELTVKEQLATTLT